MTLISLLVNLFAAAPGEVEVAEDYAVYNNNNRNEL